MRSANEGTKLEHPALLHASVDDFLAYMVPYVAGGIELGEPVFIAVGAEFLEPLRDAVDADALGVTLEDTRVWHPVPSTRLRAFNEFVGARHIRLAGEPVWPEGPPELVREWARYEYVLNAVLAHSGNAGVHVRHVAAGPVDRGRRPSDPPRRLRGERRGREPRLRIACQAAPDVEPASPRRAHVGREDGRRNGPRIGTSFRAGGGVPGRGHAATGHGSGDRRQ